MIRKVISNFLIVLILALTTGISVFRHYCSCTRQSTTFLLIEATCDNAHDANACDHHKPENHAACCSEKGQTNSSGQDQCNPAGCCTTIKNVILLDTEYQVSHSKELEITLPYIVCILPDNVSFDSGPKELLSVLMHDDPSPPIYGRQLLTAMHQLKFDIPVC
ncbi:MAG: hypothetical protein U1C46_00755 [Bacteroidales bacterium]|nr:hypothetical protein [Bacteroidales bacterium]MDZ4203319.1 hypothetical protein [Bacteroidales bacterium]